jgi:hypothetical protein
VNDPKRTLTATKSGVFNRGVPPDAFLGELIDWGRAAPAGIFSRRPNPTDAKGNKLPDPDIYTKVFPELGPWEDELHRRAVMLEVMRVLAMFESSGNFREGVDTSRLGGDTPENSEAGAWQVSYDARWRAPELAALLLANGIRSGIDFQRAMKSNHRLAMEFVARLMRNNTKHNGPLYKGNERLAIRSSLRGEEHSIYPWLRRAAVAEFRSFLS